jgi:hypothetical protein
VENNYVHEHILWVQFQFQFQSVSLVSDDQKTYLVWFFSSKQRISKTTLNFFYACFLRADSTIDTCQYGEHIPPLATLQSFASQTLELSSSPLMASFSLRISKTRHSTTYKFSKVGFVQNPKWKHGIELEMAVIAIAKHFTFDITTLHAIWRIH